MAEMESGVITHLIEIETQASVVTENAVKKASDMLAKVKNEAEQMYLEQYNAGVLKLEEEFKKTEQKIKTQSESEIEDYKKSIENSKLNFSSFNKTVDSLLKKAANEKRL